MIDYLAHIFILSLVVIIAVIVILEIRARRNAIRQHVRMVSRITETEKALEAEIKKCVDDPEDPFINTIEDLECV